MMKKYFFMTELQSISENVGGEDTRHKEVLVEIECHCIW